MPVRFTSPLPVEKKEFVEPVPQDYFIWWLFRGLCVMCKHPATEINEIIPRSRSKKSILDWKNRITICKECHNKYHFDGVNDKTVKVMQDEREKFLLTFGRKDYVGTFDKVEYA